MENNTESSPITLKMKFKYALSSQTRRAYIKINKGRIRNNDFSVISNNCWGGNFDRDFSRGYSSPFVNSFMFANCYISLIRSINLYINTAPTVDRLSMYFPKSRPYPVLHIGDIELHCIHYSNNEYAIESWKRRVDRIVMDRILYVFSFRDGASIEHVRSIKNLPIKNKLIFVPYDSDNNQEISLKFWSQGQRVGSADLIAGPSYWRTHIVDFINSIFDSDYH